jgi:hypothetical protein
MGRKQAAKGGQGGASTNNQRLEKSYNNACPMYLVNKHKSSIVLVHVRETAQSSTAANLRQGQQHMTGSSGRGWR